MVKINWINSIKDLIRESVNNVDVFLRDKDLVREKIIALTRDIIREAGYAVTDTHLGKYSDALSRIKKLHLLNQELRNLLKDHPELLYSNLVYNAVSEYVEAVIFYNLIAEKKFIGLSDIKVHPVPYLQGMLDVVGELKRHVLDLINANKISEAWQYFEIAESIYEAARVLNYPDPLVPGVRRKVDVARGIIENLRALLVDLKSRIELVKKLEEVKDLRT